MRTFRLILSIPFYALAFPFAFMAKGYITLADAIKGNKEDNK